MRMKYLIIFLGLVLCLLQSKMAVAQHCITFDYDGKGNRVERVFHDGCDREEDRTVDSSDEITPKDDISLYPNPTCGFVRLSFAECHDDCEYVIYDVNGVLRKSGYVGSDEISIYIGDFSPGTYVVNIIVDGVSYTRTVVKL